MEQREEGGMNGFVHQLPGRLKYTNVKLTRPVNADTAKIAEWIASMNGNVTRTQAQIVAKNHDATPVYTWVLEGVVPVRWAGRGRGRRTRATPRGIGGRPRGRRAGRSRVSRESRGRGLP